MNIDARKAGFAAALLWQRGRGMPEPGYDWQGWQVREWLRGWNSGVAARTGKK
jgi:hypothetical protein